MKKKIIIGSIIFVLCIGIVLLIFFLTRANSLISKPKTVKGIIFKDGKILEKNGKYSFEIVLNPSEDITVDHFDTIINDKDGNTLDIITTEVGELKKDEEKKIKMDSEMDLSSAYSVNYTVYE